MIRTTDLQEWQLHHSLGINRSVLQGVDMGYREGSMSNLVGRPRYLFLIRHADKREGHLTEDGSVHVRALAQRLWEWMHS
jgi:hypothetical protein